MLLNILWGVDKYERTYDEKMNKNSRQWFDKMVRERVKTDKEVKMEQEDIEKVDEFIHPITGKRMVLVEDDVHLDDVPDDYVLLRPCDKVGYLNDKV